MLWPRPSSVERTTRSLIVLVVIHPDVATNNNPRNCSTQPGALTAGVWSSRFRYTSGHREAATNSRRPIAEHRCHGLWACLKNTRLWDLPHAEKTQRYTQLFHVRLHSEWTLGDLTRWTHRHSAKELVKVKVLKMVMLAMAPPKELRVTVVSP